MIFCIRHLPAQEKNPLSVDVGVGCVLLDELAAWFHVFAHKHREYAVGLGGIVDLHLLENAVLGVHGCFPQLFGVHLAKTFVALYLDVLFVALAVGVDEALFLQVVPAVFFASTLGELKQRRNGKV